MAIEHESSTSLAKAVISAGSQSAFGRLIGKRQSTVNDWLKAGKPLPAEHVLKVERHTGISRHDLRPDLYPRESAPAAEHVPASIADRDALAPQR
jgi:DNA-binding transcriptional regulator YdaS (Cro superfamily)